MDTGTDSQTPQAIDYGRFSELAATLAQLDRPAYAAAGKDSSVPMMGLGPASATLCIMGRDPGRAEIAAGAPFMGASGRMLRRMLTAHTNRGAGTPPASLFWLNTVPYKPIANRAWPLAVQRLFQPLIRDILLLQWRGDCVITLGNQAFHWFGIGQPPAEQARMAAYWSGGRRYIDPLRILVANAERQRWLTLYPLPHPSPANAVWRERFPALLQRHLDALTSSHEK
ncbi:uracil-DNA glycosylase family protein [Paralcaligenes sp. KSB-10]|jgi:uracil-DNA glycosylase family 4|uniref:uracil-DNA glycosylase family protein n=1 Tax=Paralcaligenes sp. KSB-10 TaxID=2901142 RepID=UPI001E5F8E1C|nr:uracil-DNA glycosylase family protein [Paralcaligenes sp. KSB-10]UHL64968.1 uracil-DNA glycosylase family protein [Paralcaligenes sp. KSB-10]